MYPAILRITRRSGLVNAAFAILPLGVSSASGRFARIELYPDGDDSRRTVALGESTTMAELLRRATNLFGPDVCGI